MSTYIVRCLRSSLLLLLLLVGACRAPVDGGQGTIDADVTARQTVTPETRSSEAAAQVQPKNLQPSAGPTLLLVTTETGRGLDFVKQVAAEFNSQSTWHVEVVAKAPDELRIDLQTALLADAAPELIWASADQARVLAAAELLQPVTDLFVADAFMPAAVADSNLQGVQWGVPVSAGDQLVLLYNRSLVAAPPATTDDLLSMQRPAGADALLAYDARDPLWLNAWLQGFGGSLRGADGRPTLNAPQMVQTLFFLQELKNRGVVPAEIDAAGAQALFREGKAAMWATHAWMLASFAGADAQPFEVGMAPLPRAAATGRAPAAGLPGAQLLLGKGVDGDRRAAAKAFVTFVSGQDVQQRIASEFRRLPALKSVLQGQAVQSDPSLQALAASQSEITALQTNDALLDVIGPRLAQVLAGERPVEEVVQEMQDVAVGTSGE